MEICHEIKPIQIWGSPYGYKDPTGPGRVKIYQTGVCVMFHSGPEPDCLNRYCDTCLPYVKATDFSDFGKA